MCGPKQQGNAALQDAIAPTQAIIPSAMYWFLPSAGVTAERASGDAQSFQPCALKVAKSASNWRNAESWRNRLKSVK